MSWDGRGSNTQWEDFFIFVTLDVNTNIVLVVKFTNVFYVYRVLDIIFLIFRNSIRTVSVLYWMYQR